MTLTGVAQKSVPKHSLANSAETVRSKLPRLASLRAAKPPAGRAIACLALLFFAPPVVHASPQDIVVRLVDPRSAKPLSKVSVAMISWSGDLSGRAMMGVEPHERAQSITDAEGRAVFHLPQPPPEHLGFLLVLSSDFCGCWKRNPFSPETILRSGIVAEYDESKCGKLRTQVSAKPGEVIIFEKKLTWWQQLRRELP